MSRRVLKYEIRLADEQTVFETPGSSEFLAVGAQGERLVVWMLVTDGRTMFRAFKPVGTGHLILDDEAWHVGTVQMGEFVWHVFEVLPDA